MWVGEDKAWEGKVAGWGEVSEGVQDPAWAAKGPRGLLFTCPHRSCPGPCVTP